MLEKGVFQFEEQFRVPYPVKSLGDSKNTALQYSFPSRILQLFRVLTALSNAFHESQISDLEYFLVADVLFLFYLIAAFRTD